MEENKEEKQIDKRTYAELNLAEKELYNRQWQRWQSGWVDCSEQKQEVVGCYRLVYRLQSEYTATPSPNKAIDLEKLGYEVDAVIANETAETYNKFFGNKAIGESVSEAALRLYPVEMAMKIPKFNNIENWDINLDTRNAYISGYQESHNEMVKVIEDKRDEINQLKRDPRLIMQFAKYDYASFVLTNILTSIGGKE